MNDTSYELIQASIESYEKIWKKYHLNSNVISIPAIKIKTIMPLNLKTKTKLDLFRTFGDNVTEVQFVQLLMRQTTGADLINMVYIIKYYNLQFDSNGMIIWTDECPYVNFKQEVINNWYIWHTLTTHNMFGKYMEKLLVFKLQSRLESSLFPTNENMKNDLYFTNRSLVNATNEKQHELQSQKELDTISIALHKMHGISVISFYTNAFVNITEIKKTIYNNLCDNVDNNLDTMLTEIYNVHDITNIYTQNIIKIQTCMMIRNYFKHKPLKDQKLNVLRFKNLQNSIVIKKTITDILNRYLLVINRTIHAKIKNNKYLKSYTSTLLDTLLSSCLNDTKFSQDYDQIIIAETLIGDMQVMTNAMEIIQGIAKKDFLEKYQDDYNDTCDSFTDLNNIAKKFIIDSKDYIVMYKLRLKSLRNPNNINTITLQDVQKIFKMSNITDMNDIIDIIIRTCGISRYETNILISWRQLQKILFKFNMNPALQKVLLFQYTMADDMYKRKEDRLKVDAKCLICTPDNFNNYYGRIYKKFSIVIYSCINSMQNMFNDNLHMYTIKNPKEIVLEKIIGFTLINSPDATMIAQVNIKERFNNIVNEFNSLTIPDVEDTYVPLTPNNSSITNDRDDEDLP